MTLFYLKNKGFLDASVRTRLFVSKKGFAKLKVVGNEGELYLWGGFQFKDFCETPKEFYRNFGKPLGTPFGYLDLYTALERTSKICKRKGYFSVYTFYTEPFKVERRVLTSYLWRNFRIKPGFVIDFLSVYLDVLIQNPVKGIGFLIRPNYAVVPEIVVYKGGIYKLKLEGVRRLSEKTLKESLFRWMESQPFITPSLLARHLLEIYRREGFLDAEVSAERKGDLLILRVKEGKRYRLLLKVEPPLLREVPCRYYSEACIQRIKEDLVKLLKEGLYLYDRILVGKKIDRERKLVEVDFLVKNARKVSLKVFKEIRVKDEGIKKLVKEKLKSFDWREALYRKGALKGLKRDIFDLLKSRKCVNPKVEYDVRENPNEVVTDFKVSCEGRRKFGPTVYWVEGRLPTRELEYMLPDFSGKRFNKKLLDILSVRLDKSRLFDSYTVKTVDVANNETVPVVEGTERKPITLEGSVGFSSDEGYLFDGRLTFTDMLRMGERFTLRLLLTQKRNLYTLSYYDDYFFSKRLFTSSSLFKNYEEHRDYTIDYKGYSLTLGWHLNLYGDLSATYTAMIYDLNTLLPERRGGNLQKISLNYQHFYPIYTGSVRSGTFTAYLNYIFALSRGNYKKITGGFLLSKIFGDGLYAELKASAGWAGRNTPIFEKFYLGGIKNLKGYSYESVAPLGGGELFWYTGFEVGFPIFGKGIYLFGGADFGNAVKRHQNPFKEIKRDIFLGAGTVTAMGPIRFVVAAPLEGEVNLSTLKYLLLVGFDF